MQELIIIGGGPAAAGAAVYSARKKIKTLIITPEFAGQSVVSNEIGNWIGSKSISGLDLSKNLEDHVRSFVGPDLAIEEDKVVAVSKVEKGFIITTEKGKSFDTHTILVASGSRRKRLGIPGEDRLDGKGVAWCATCDAPLFSGVDVVVIGGGNAGLESVLDLHAYAKKIYLLHRRDNLKADEVTQEKVRALSNVEIILNTEPKEILGDNFVSGIRCLDKVANEEKTLPVSGIFIEIGSLPNSDFVKDLVERNVIGEIVVDHKTQSSSLPGIWAAGDVTDVLYKQNNISVGDAIKAILSIFDYLHHHHR
ncbi:MAG: pyridine nucleotide-disulfide oxidoreductase [Candidatus Harrisonbacteria bacterium]|nr:pyridine nucleotide-disulfide oxidoreductase [Candidatus Harrisonbacteria bacterium]